MPRIRTIVVAAFVAAMAITTPALSQTISFYTLAAEVGSGLQTGLQRVRLSDDQHGGITVRIESADTSLTLVTTDDLTPGGRFVDVFVPNGQSDATFYVQALEDTAGTAHLNAVATGFATGLDSIDVVTPGFRLTGLSTSHDPFDPDDQFYLTVGLPNSTNTTISLPQKVRVGGPGLTVTITNSSAATGQLVTTALTAQVVSVAILPGETSSPTSVATGGVAFDGLAPGSSDVDATIPGFNPVNSIPQTVTVTAPLVTFTNLPVDVGSGLQVSARRARVSGAQHGGVTVHIESSDSNLVLLAEGRYDAGSPSLDVFLPNGSIDAIFYVQALEDTTGGVVVTASAPGFAGAVGTANVVEPYYRISGLGSSIDTLDPNDTFYLTMGLPNAALSSIPLPQQARGGGGGVTWTVTSSDSSVGLLETTTTLNDTATVYVAPGQSNSPTSLATGGVAFDGVGAGVTTVTASSPGFTPVSTGIVDVTVTQPVITFSNQPPIGLGAGLQPTGTYRAVLSATQHGGVTVHIETPDTHLALISADGATVGGSAIDVFIPNGQTQAQFYLQGIEDTTGVASITATTSGFVTGVLHEDVVQPSVRISNTLSGTIDTIDPPDPFQAQVGVANTVNHFAQDVRPGSPGVVVTLALDDSTVAELQTLTDTSHTVTVAVAAGENLSANTVALGGVAFNGLSPGVATVTPSAPGFIVQPNGDKTVTVVAPSLNIGAQGTICAGLQGGQRNVTLSASNHGGVTVHIESLHPDIALVSAAAASPGQASVDVAVTDGAATAAFWVHGVDATTGTFHITATAPAFIADTDSGVVVQPGVEIVGLGASIDVIDPADAFYARVGVPNGDNSDVISYQDRRAGAPPLVVTLVSSNGAAAELIKTAEASDTVTVLIAPGSNSSPTSVASGGAALNGLALGQTVVTAAIPGFTTTGTGQRVVDVSNQNIFINGLTTRLGWSLQSVAAAAELGNPGHGGTTVHIEVDDTTRAYISGNALVEGDDAVDVYLSPGNTEAVFYLQARDNVTGQVTVTVTAPSFPAAVQNVNIVAPGLEIFELADSMAVTDPDDEFVVRVGAVNADSSGIHEAQALRGGGPSRTLTVTSSNGQLAFITLGNNLDVSRQYVMDPGEYETPVSVVAGGFALTTWNVGQLNVIASTPDFFTTDEGMPLVTITGTPTGTGSPPVAFALEQNIPNPFNPTTTIHFSLPAAELVGLTVYDVAGRRVARLVNRHMPAGRTSVQWNGVNDRGGQVPSGVYFYRLVAGAQVETRKMVLLK